jgi:type IV secretion system protein VirB4
MALWQFIAIVLPTLICVVAALSSGTVYSMKWLKTRGKLGVDRAIRYDYRAKDGIIAFDDNRLIVGWEVRGPDFDASTFAQQAAHIAAHNDAVRKLSEEWCLDYFDFSVETKGYPNGNAATDPTTAVMAWARRQRYLQAFRQFKHEQYITATFTPPSAVVNALSRMMLDESVKEHEDTTAEYERALADFEANIRELEDALGAVFKMKALKKKAVTIDARRVVVDELVSLLYRTITGTKMDVVCEGDGDVRRILTSMDFQGGWFPRIDDKYVAVVSVEDTPTSSIPGLLDALADLRMEYCRATKIVFISQEKAKGIAKGAYYRQREGAQSLMSKVSANGGATDSVVDPGALENAEEARKALGDVTRGFVKYVLWSNRVVLRGEKLGELHKAARKAKSAIQKVGFTSRVETFNNAEAFVGYLPGDIDHDKSPLQLDTIAAGDLSPISSTYLGQSVHPNPMMPANTKPLYRMLTYGSQPYDFIPCVDDVQHMFLVGPTGAGKSTIVNSLIAAGFAQWEGTQVFMFDQGRSAERYCLASGGDFYELDPSNKSVRAVGFAPLSNIEDGAEFNWAAEWIETDLLGLQGVKLAPDRQKKLRTALSILVQQPKDSRTITELQHTLLGSDPEMAGALEHYTIAGPLGRLLDSPTDSLSESRFQVFEMGILMKSRDERMIVPVLQYIFHRIEQRIGKIHPPTQKPVETIVVLDESPEYLVFPSFAKTIGYWLDKIRKNNGAVWLATLRLADFMRLPIADAILDSCKTKVYLPNPEASNAMFNLYEKTGRTIEDALRIASGTAKRHLFICQEESRANVHTDVDEVELAFTGASRPEDRAQTARLWEKHGRAMGGPLLREYGLHEAADKWEHFAAQSSWERRRDRVEPATKRNGATSLRGASEELASA